MTRLTTFLTSLYDSLSDAELQALEHGQARLAERLAAGTIPPDASVPVYHATDVEVTLDVAVQAEETDAGTDIYLREAAAEDASQLAFTVELFDLLEERDLESLAGEDVLAAAETSLPAAESPDDRSEGEAGPEGETEAADQTDDGETDADDPGAADTEATSDGPETHSVDVVRGIGPEYREALAAQGIETVADLVDHSPDDLADRLSGEEVDVSPERTGDWVDQARGLATALAEADGDRPVELVDGIGPTYGERLRTAGIETLADLVEQSPDDIAAAVSTDELSVGTDRTTRWIDEARGYLRAFDTVEEADADRPPAEEHTPDTTTNP